MLRDELSGFSSKIEQRLDEKLSTRFAAQPIAVAPPAAALWHMVAAAAVGALMAICAGSLGLRQQPSPATASASWFRS